MIQAKLAAHGTACFAHEQTKGKGQRGKTWNAEPGANIMLSVVLNTAALQLYQQFYLSAAMALAAYESFAAYAGEETSIKWPNDIYWRDRKAGGILIETRVKSETGSLPTPVSPLPSPASQLQTANWPWAVVGTGININQTVFLPAIKNPVSLKQITGKDFNPVLLARELCSLMDKWFLLLEKGEFSTILKLYNQHLYKRNETVTLKKKNVVFNCQVNGVNEKGELQTTGAMQDTFSWGEVEWVLS